MNKKILVILAHPDKESFNHAIANAVIEEFQADENIVLFHDLYEEKFDPILSTVEIPKDAQLPTEIQVHCDEISDADRRLSPDDHRHSADWCRPSPLL